MDSNKNKFTFLTKSHREEENETVTCKGIIKAMFPVFKAVTSSTSNHHAGVKKVLVTRAWFLSVVRIIYNIVLFITGKSYLLSETQSCFDHEGQLIEATDGSSADCILFDSNSELINKIRPTFRVICILLHIVTSINCIAICKWRWLSSGLIYLESVSQIFQALASIERGIFMSEYSFQHYCAIFLALYTGGRTQIIITALA